MSRRFERRSTHGVVTHLSVLLRVSTEWSKGEIDE
jgi:hypothetical protein